MPWHIEKGGGTCAGSEWAVIKDSDGSTAGCHDTEAAAKAQLAALYANEPGAKMSTTTVAVRGETEIDPGMLELRAAACRQNPRAVPDGQERPDRACLAQWRVEPIDRNDESRTQLAGYASIVNKAYPMWDSFGPYEEIISGGAFDETLGGLPDVNFLINHRGLAMARTTNGTLELSADQLGLRSVAFLNPKRQDVQDLLLAIQDRDITEMSFAFRIPDGGGHWSDDFTQFFIDRVDLNRGDVSAVNYGANPYTSIAARASEILAELDHLPTGAARAALRSLQNRADIRLNLQQPPPGDQSRRGSGDQSGMADKSETQPEGRGQSEPMPYGLSVELVRNMLQLEEVE